MIMSVSNAYRNCNKWTVTYNWGRAFRPSYNGNPYVVGSDESDKAIRILYDLIVILGNGKAPDNFVNIDTEVIYYFCNLWYKKPRPELQPRIDEAIQLFNKGAELAEAAYHAEVKG